MLMNSKLEKKDLGFRLENPFRALKNSLFFYFWIFQAFSLLGNWVDYTLRQWLITIIFTNPNYASQFTGNFNLVRFIPSLVLSFFSGIIIDRVGYRNVLIVIHVIDFINSCIITYLVYTNKINGFYLLLFAFISGITMSFYFSARSTFIKNVIKKEADLTSAFSLQGLTFNLSRVVGPIIGAFLAKNYGLYVGFLFNTISFIPLILLLSFSKSINSNEIDISDDKVGKSLNIFEDIKEAFRYIYRNSLILKSFVSISVVNFFGVSLVSLLQVFTKELLRGNISNFSVILSSLGIGAIIGALFVASLNPEFVIKFKEEILIFFYGVFYLIISFFPFSVYYLMFLIGFMQSLLFGICNNRVQILTDSFHIARVISFYSVLNISLGLLGAFLGGNIAYFIGLLLVYKIFSSFILFSAIYIFFLFKK